MAKETFYFSHDYHARRDKKLIRLLSKMGVEAIGIYWCVIEMLYEDGGYLSFSECDCIADELRTDCERINLVIKNFQLFDNDGDRFWSNSVLNRLEIRNLKSNKAKESANYRWSNANALQSQSEGNAIKEKKGNKIKGKEREFTVPSFDDVKKYFEEKGYSERSAERAYNYYSDLDWYDKHGNEIKSWKAKMLSIWFKPENLKEAPVIDIRNKPIDHRNNTDIESWIAK